VDQNRLALTTNYLGLFPKNKSSKGLYGSREELKIRSRENPDRFPKLRIIDSTDSDYVMRRIRELYIGDSTVTLVMLGKCTWARRYVDWEIQASLRAPQDGLPNGLLGIKLPTYPEGTGFPERFNRNLLSAQSAADVNGARPSKVPYAHGWKKSVKQNTATVFGVHEQPRSVGTSCKRSFYGPKRGRGMPSALPLGSTISARC